MNPIQEYISKQKEEFEEKFPHLYNGSERWSKEEVDAFLTSSLIVLIDIIEQEIDTLFTSENDIVDLDILGKMFTETRKTYEDVCPSID